MKLNELNLNKDINTPVNNDTNLVRYLIIETKYNDQIILILDRSIFDNLLSEYPNTPIYFPQEIDELYNKCYDNPDLLYKTHRVKKMFNGWVVPKN